MGTSGIPSTTTQQAQPLGDLLDPTSSFEPNGAAFGPSTIQTSQTIQGTERVAYNVYLMDMTRPRQVIPVP